MLDDPAISVYTGGLPIKPIVTPGMGVAGIFLMLGGLACCLVGIKIKRLVCLFVVNHVGAGSLTGKRLHIFLSSAFLAGLSVTVLIIYVMNPPVGNILQGGYVAATIITGLVVGGLSIVFPEVTEGLGCLLGGFCLSMWCMSRPVVPWVQCMTDDVPTVLVLKPGGLVTTTYGKLIMIGSFCFAIFALALHRVTRPWGLIGSLSFAGATAVVLGIDCYSRAGLKEFWIYIWNLNDDLFPLGTNTYPHTKGMKVEIAAIFLITAVGIMSQMKLWKIIEERKKANDVIARQHAADLQAVDEETGRRVQAECQAERSQWEAVYGDDKDTRGSSSMDRRPATGTSKADSGLGDGDSRASGDEAKDMKEVREEHPGGPSADKEIAVDDQTRAIIPLGFDEAPPVSVSGTLVEDTPESCAAETKQKDLEEENEADMEASPAKSKERLNSSFTPPPAVVPLPLPLLREDDDEADSDTFSQATKAYSERYSVNMEADVYTPQIDLQLPYDRTSKASSLAATCDERQDEIVDLQAPPQTDETDDDVAMTSMGSLQIESKYLSAPAQEDRKPELAENNVTILNSLESPSITPNRDATVEPSESSPQSEVSKAPAMLPHELVPASYPKSKTSSSVSKNSGYEIQTQCSKVVKTFRTNEWAKHLQEAERPELEALPAATKTSDPDHELPAPLDVHELGGGTPSPVLATRRESTRANKTPSPALPARASLRASSSAARMSHSAETLSPPERASRAMSPFPAENQALLVERATKSAGSAVRGESFVKQGTLLGKRESLVRGRASFTTLGFDARSLSSPSPAQGRNSADPYRSGSAMGHAQKQAGIPRRQTSQMLSDDMSLAERQLVLQQKQQLQARRSLNKSPSQRRGTPMPDKLSTWREGVRREVSVGAGADLRRQEMLDERERAATESRAVRAAQGVLRPGFVEERMRQKDMIELHQEALRKMQAEVNRNIS